MKYPILQLTSKQELEVKKIKKIYRYDNIRYTITSILKSTGLYNLLLPFRNNRFCYEKLYKHSRKYDQK